MIQTILLSCFSFDFFLHKTSRDLYTALSQNLTKIRFANALALGKVLGNGRYNELSQKNRFQPVRVAALCLYNIQRENLVVKKSLSS